MTHDTVQSQLVNPDDVAPNRPEGACTFYADCGNLAPLGRRLRKEGRDWNETTRRLEICNDCLDTLRAADR